MRTMSKALLAAAAVALLAAAARPWRVARGDGPGKGNEIRVVAIRPSDYEATDTWREIQARHPRDPAAAYAEIQTHVLGRLGAEGWSLVHVDAKGGGLIYYYVQRPVR